MGESLVRIVVGAAALFSIAVVIPVAFIVILIFNCIYYFGGFHKR